jgi:hypothetical protein
METKKQLLIDADFDLIYDTIIDRLDQLGEIRTIEVYKMLNISYARVCVQFKRIMDIMVLQGKAVKVRKGHWNILKPNRRKAA